LTPTRSVSTGNDGRNPAATVELTGIPREHVRFSCTHTHSGPNTFRLGTISEGLDMVLSYLDGLPRRIASAVWQAQLNLTPVRCAAGSGSCTINVNRRFRTEDGAIVVGRNWQGIVDQTVRVVSFDDLQEKPVATIVHYACHPTTMAWQTQLFTPDYPGRRRVGSTLEACASSSGREPHPTAWLHGRLPGLSPPRHAAWSGGLPRGA
jgi:hypothetical protein